MHNDNIKEVSPVSSHHVCHSFIPARRKEKAGCNRADYPCDESEWTRANAGLHLHKAKRTVGDEEEFLSMTNQSMQNSLCLLPSQNELIYEEPVDRMLFYVQQCAGWIQKEESFLTEIFHDPFVHISFEVNHANCFLRIK